MTPFSEMFRCPEPVLRGYESEVQSVRALDLRAGDRIIGRQICRVTKVRKVGGLVQVSILMPWKSRYIPNRMMRRAICRRPGELVLIAARPPIVKRSWWKVLRG